MKQNKVIAALIMVAGVAYSATVINVDSNTQMGSVSANQFFHYSGNQLNSASVPIDMTTPRVTKGTNNYNAPDVYAGASRSLNSASNFGLANNSGSAYRIRLNSQVTAGHNFEILNMFLVGEGAYTATFNTDNDTLSAGGYNTTPASVTSDSYRFVVLDDGNWYVSGKTDTSTANSWTATVEAKEVLWYSFNPTVAYASPGIPDIDEETPASPVFENVSAVGTLHELATAGGAGNFGMKTFSVTASINGEVAAWAPTNSINWSNADYDGAAVTQGGNKGFDFSTTSHYANEDMGTGGPTIYGAAYSPEAAYIYADSAQTNSTGTFDYRFSQNNNGGLGMRVGRPAGGVVSGTNINSGVISAYTLHMFPVTGLAENDANITLQTWSNQGAGGVNMMDGEIRFVVAKNYAGTTNWAISSPVEHSVGTNQYKTVNTAVRFQGLDWFNYNPANAWSVDDVGSQVLAPYPGDALAVGFRLYAGGVSKTNNTAFVFGARSFTYSESEWNEYDNDNLVVDADPQTAWNETGGNGVQFELGSFAFSEDTPIVQSNAIIGAGLGGGQETNWWEGASVYAGFVADGAYPAPVQGYDYASNLESNYNSAALSVAGTSGGDGFKIQWNGSWQNDVGTIPELDYQNGRYQAGDKATALFVWKSDDFLGGSDGSTYEMTAANDVIKATVSYADRDGVLGTGKVRFVIKENDQYYISYMVTNFTDEAGDVELVRQGTTTAWFAYDPIADISSVDTSTNATQASLDLTDVQAFGVWIEATVATNTGYRLYPRLGVDRFQAGAIVITPTASSIKQAWLDTYGSGMSGATADSDDPDGDGFANILEYAFGGDPTDDTSTGNQPSHGVVDADGADVLEFIYYERTDASSRGLSTSLKESSNLVFEDFEAATVTVVGTGSGPSGFNAVTNHVPVDDDEKFIRVDVNYSAE